jgi:hypothetical protein
MLNIRFSVHNSANDLISGSQMRFSISNYFSKKEKKEKEKKKLLNCTYALFCCASSQGTSPRSIYKRNDLQ